jgi:hypothetical protein
LKVLYIPKVSENYEIRENFFYLNENLENSKFAASKKKIGKSLLSQARFPTFVVRRRNRPAGEGNLLKNRAKPKRGISPSSRVASSDRMIMASSLFRV